MKQQFLNLSIIAFLSFGCARGVDQDYVKTLKPTPFPSGNLEISIPSNYFITKNVGPDYDVFYVMPIDTANKKLFTAGLYLGNNPSAFRKLKSGCVETKREIKVFETQHEWSVFDCNGLFFTESIIKNKYSMGGDEFIHCFGNCTNEEDLEHILAIFSTLKKR